VRCRYCMDLSITVSQRKAKRNFTDHDARCDQVQKATSRSSCRHDAAAGQNKSSSFWSGEQKRTGKKQQRVGAVSLPNNYARYIPILPRCTFRFKEFRIPRIRMMPLLRSPCAGLESTVPYLVPTRQSRLESAITRLRATTRTYPSSRPLRI